MKRKCNFCGREFKLKNLDDTAEYCKTICWEREHGLAEKDNHYGGGHKTIKRKKNGKTK